MFMYPTLKKELQACSEQRHKAGSFLSQLLQGHKGGDVSQPGKRDIKEIQCLRLQKLGHHQETQIQQYNILQMLGSGHSSRMAIRSFLCFSMSRRSS